MTTRIQSIAVLLMIGAALAATPVLAADAVPGNKGPADKGINRDAPVSLPANITPLPTPKVDPGSLSRGIFEQDEAAGLDGLGTLTLSRRRQHHRDSGLGRCARRLQRGRPGPQEVICPPQTSRRPPDRSGGLHRQEDDFDQNGVLA